ncbi:MAG: hypothetical protein ACOCVA_03365 [Prolixibacteraceae bacterium]
MKFDSDRVWSLINNDDKSLSAIANEISMSHTGLKSALEKSSFGVKNLIKLAEYFNKPIEYFFTDCLENSIEEKASNYNQLTSPVKTNTPDHNILEEPTSPDFNTRCKNPECIKEISFLKDENMELHRELRKLTKEKIEWLEQQKGALEPGKKVRGDVEEPRKTGT